MTSFTQVSNSNTHNRDCMKLARFKTARDSKRDSASKSQGGFNPNRYFKMEDFSIFFMDPVTLDFDIYSLWLEGLNGKFFSENLACCRIQ